jgi:mitotic spindle assembly checkpoint protein MAD1
VRLAALEEADAAAASLAEQLESAEQALFELRGDVAAGTHIPPGVRVLSLRENPAQAWADSQRVAADRLKKENSALMARIRALEDAGAVAGHAPPGAGEDGDGAVVPRESWEAAVAEKDALGEAVRQKEKRLVRLQEVRVRRRARLTRTGRAGLTHAQIFKAKSAEFRGAIAAILGVKLAFYPNGQVRVTSVYDLHASFVFQPAAGGTSAHPHPPYHPFLPRLLRPSFGSSRTTR